MRPSLERLVLCLAGVAAACGGGAGDVTPPAANQPPVASFALSCVDLTCGVSDSSRDADGTIAAYRWSFGDGSADETGKDASHTYAAPGGYIVVHTVVDDAGDSAAATREAEVVAPAPDVPPAAWFEFACADLTCGFTDRSYDTDGSIASQHWTFGDGAEATGATPTHTYGAAGTYHVAVTATDDRGSATTTARDVTVTAPGLPEMTVSPESLTICTRSIFNRSCFFTSRRVTITSTGSQQLAWAASTSQPWIVLDSTSGVTPSEMVVTVDPGKVRTTYEGVITVAAPGAVNSPRTIVVSYHPYGRLESQVAGPAELVAHPMLAVSDSAIGFCYRPSTTRNCVFLSERVRVSSTVRSLHWHAAADVPWLVLSPTGGTTPAGLRISVDLKRVPQPHGDQVFGGVTVSSVGAANSPLRIRVTLFFIPIRF
jgi:PKD repeat protein